MKRAMARQAEAEREKRAKIINAEGESRAAAALGMPGPEAEPPSALMNGAAAPGWQRTACARERQRLRSSLWPVLGPG
jgi:regulator of protease activity HflC (stomatin/prohibitin superfamily)